MSQSVCESCDYYIRVGDGFGCKMLIAFGKECPFEESDDVRNSE